MEIMKIQIGLIIYVVLPLLKLQGALSVPVAIDGADKHPTENEIETITKCLEIISFDRESDRVKSLMKTLHVSKLVQPVIRHALNLMKRTTYRKAIMSVNRYFSSKRDKKIIDSVLLVLSYESFHRRVSEYLYVTVQQDDRLKNVNNRSLRAELMFENWRKKFGSPYYSWAKFFTEEIDKMREGRLEYNESSKIEKLNDS